MRGRILVSLALLLQQGMTFRRQYRPEGMGKEQRQQQNFNYLMVLGGTGILFRDEANFVHEVKRLATKYNNIQGRHTVAFIGAAMFDDAKMMNLEKWVQAWAPEGSGWTFRHVDLSTQVYSEPLREVYKQSIERAAVVLCSGGNAPFLRRKIKTWTLGESIKKAADGGAVLAGGSAGALIYTSVAFTIFGEQTFMEHKAKQLGCTENAQNHPCNVVNEKVEQQGKLRNSLAKNGYPYFLTEMLGLFPFVVSPHCDGASTWNSHTGRATGIEKSVRLQRHMAFVQALTIFPRKVGVCIDNEAAVVFDGQRDTYDVIRARNESGPVLSWRPNDSSRHAGVLVAEAFPSGALGAKAPAQPEGVFLHCLNHGTGNVVACDLPDSGSLRDFFNHGTSLGDVSIAQALEDIPENNVINEMQD